MLQRKCVPHAQGSEYNNQCRIYIKIVVINPDEKRFYTENDNIEAYVPQKKLRVHTDPPCCWWQD